MGNLVLARRPGERILIGDDIVVTILDCGRRKVRVGISAPPSVRVDREETRRRQDAKSVATIWGSVDALDVPGDDL